MNLLIDTLILINSVLMLGASPSDLCPKFSESPVYLPDEDCGKFYECRNGIASLFNCPPGLQFNVKLNVCDWPDRAGCEQRKTTEVPSTTVSTEVTTLSTTTPIPSTITTQVPTHETTLTTEVPTEKTTLSTSIATSSITTPVPTYETTLTTEETTLSTIITTTTSSITTPVSTHETTISTEVPTVPSTITTQVPTHETTLITTTTTPVPTQETTPSASSFKTTNRSTKVPNSTIETTTVVTNICSQQPDKSFLAPNSRDCTKYLYCNYGTMQIMNCPNGRYFNPIMLICTLPSQAGCHI